MLKIKINGIFVLCSMLVLLVTACKGAAMKEGVAETAAAALAAQDSKEDAAQTLSDCLFLYPDKRFKLTDNPKKEVQAAIKKKKIQATIVQDDQNPMGAFLTINSSLKNFKILIMKVNKDNSVQVLDHVIRPAILTLEYDGKKGVSVTRHLFLQEKDFLK